MCPTRRTVLVLAQTSRYPEKERWFFARLLKYFEGGTLNRDALRASLTRAGADAAAMDAHVAVWVLRRRRQSDDVDECDVNG